METKHTPGPWYISLVEDRPTHGMWHCGPNAGWIEVTHLPTMISARAFGKSQHKAKQAAMNCCEMLIEESGVATCQFPERIPHPGVSELSAVAPDLLEALEEAEKHFGPFADITINGKHDEEDVRVVSLIRAVIAKARGQ